MLMLTLLERASKRKRVGADGSLRDGWLAARISGMKWLWSLGHAVPNCLGNSTMGSWQWKSSSISASKRATGWKV